ncbi:MAG: class I SAM-dependent methyltransferase [Nitrososphaerota archaeon]
MKHYDAREWGRECAKSFHKLAHKTKFEIDRLNRTLVQLIPPNSLVLDAGCGKAGIATLPNAGVWKVIGVDISPDLIKIATKNKSSPHHQFLIADITRLPFKNGSFNAVVFIAVLHHIPNVEVALKEAKRVLRSSGILFIQEPNKYSYQLFFLGKRAPFSSLVWGKLHDPNERPLDPKKILEILRKENLKSYYEGVNIIPLSLLSILPKKSPKYLIILIGELCVCSPPLLSVLQIFVLSLS